MNDIERVMWEAWEVVGPMLEADREELRARLARRRGVMYRRPPRAFCLAVRASDLRITPYSAAMIPEHAMKLSSEWHRGRVIEHTVEVTAELLRKVTEPVRILPPGEPADDVAKRLGCPPDNLRKMRANGTLRVHYYPGLLGRHGPPVPMVYTKEVLDPSAAGRQRPDPIWGSLWFYHAKSLRDDFAQVVWRWPDYRTVKGKSVFRGWRWECPGCRRRVRTLYLPMELPDWGRYVGFRPEESEVDEVPRPVEALACHECHGVVFFTRARLGFTWNHLVLCYTGGLMYGREVRRPEWFTEKRKRKLVARKKGARWHRVKGMMEAGMSIAAMAMAEGTTYGTINTMVGRIRRAGEQESRRAGEQDSRR